MEYKEMSYNLFLYEKRNELGLTKREFAKMLGINYLKYRVIEDGYIKPNKKDIESISKALDIDFSFYMQPHLTYPDTIPDKPKRKLTIWAYDFIGSLVIRLTIIVFFILSVGAVIASIILTDIYETHSKDYHEEKVVNVYNGVLAYGSVTIDLLDSFIRREIYEETKVDRNGKQELAKLVTIKAHLNDRRISDTEFKIDYWEDDYRITLTFTATSSIILNTSTPFSRLYTTPTILARYVDYASTDYYEIEYSETARNEFATKVKKQQVTTEYSKLEEAMEIADQRISTYNEDLEKLISDKLGYHYDLYEDIMKGILRTNKIIKVWENIIEAMYLGGVLFTLLSLFALAYSILFGTKNGVGPEYSMNDDYLYQKKKSTLKINKDIRFTPVIPETALEIIGIIIILISSIRMLFYFSFALGNTYVSYETIQISNEIFMPLFYIGMFLLYFIDFDKFIGDKRAIRNIFMYVLLFIGLYMSEMYLISFIKSKDSVIFNFIDLFTLPNMFLSIAMYFVLMYFLFFTPRFLNTRKKLIVFRCLSLIPTILLAFTYVTFKAANAYWGWNLSTEFLYLFDSERVSFSILCIFYLYGLFFLRLFYKKKYGAAEANRYFNGNRFIMQKNIMMCIILLLVAGVEFMLKDNTVARKLGFGMNYYIIFLIPLVLFYHPHKGERKVALDILMSALYMLAVSFFAFLVIITVLFN